LDLKSAVAPGDADGGVGDGGGGEEVVGDEVSLCSTDDVARVTCAGRRRSLSIAVCVGGVDVEHNVVCSCASESAIALGTPPHRLFFLPFDSFSFSSLHNFSLRNRKI